jgi:hypothetical protein
VILLQKKTTQRPRKSVYRYTVALDMFDSLMDAYTAP